MHQGDGWDDAAGGAGDYEVGYCRPPLHSRFRKGERPNPNGRLRGARNRKTLVRRVAEESRDLRQEGELRRVSTLELVIRVVRNKAALGDRKAFRLCNQLLGRLEEPHNQVPKGVLILGEKLTEEEWIEEFAHVQDRD